MSELQSQLASVESSFVSCARAGGDPSHLEELRSEWQGFLALVSKLSIRLVNFIDLHRPDCKDKDKLLAERIFQEARIEALNNAARMIAKTRDPGAALLAAVRSVTDPGVACIQTIKDQLREEIKSQLHAAANGRRVSPAISCSDAFSLASDPDLLNSLRATNTQRWLTDVLKWQVLDLNLQRREKADAETLQELLMQKEKDILAAMESRVDKEMNSGSVRRHALESAADSLLARVEAVKGKSIKDREQLSKAAVASRSPVAVALSEGVADQEAAGVSQTRDFTLDSPPVNSHSVDSAAVVSSPALVASPELSAAPDYRALAKKAIAEKMKAAEKAVAEKAVAEKAVADKAGQKAENSTTSSKRGSLAAEKAARKAASVALSGVADPSTSSLLPVLPHAASVDQPVKPLARPLDHEDPLLASSPSSSSSTLKPTQRELFAARLAGKKSGVDQKPVAKEVIPKDEVKKEVPVEAQRSKPPSRGPTSPTSPPVPLLDLRAVTRDSNDMPINKRQVSNDPAARPGSALVAPVEISRESSSSYIDLPVSSQFRKKPVVIPDDDDGTSKSDEEEDALR